MAYNTPVQGHNTYVGVGVQASAGTAVSVGTGIAATQKVKYEVVNFRHTASRPVVNDNSLNSTARTRRALFPGGLVHRGSFVTRGNYNNNTVFPELLFGSRTTTVASGAVNKHVFPENQTFKVNTLEVQTNLGAVSGAVIQLYDLVVSGVTMRWTAGTGDDAMLQQEWAYVAAGFDKNLSGGATGTPGAMTVSPAQFNEIDTTVDILGVGDSAATLVIRSCEVSMQFPYSDDRFTAGQVNILAPVPSDFGTCTWRFTVEYGSSNAHALLVSGANAAPNVKFVRTGTSGATAEFINYKSAKAVVTEVGTPFEQYGVVLQNVTLSAYYDATSGAALYVETRNQDAA